MTPISANLGPCDILIIGEKPTDEEVKYKKPFIGIPGYTLEQMLTEAGLHKNSCAQVYVASTNFPGTGFYKIKEAKLRQVDKVNGKFPIKDLLNGLAPLKKAIELCKPKVIIPMGDIALWAISSQSSVSKWRGSIMEVEINDEVYKVIPTLSVESVIKMWANRWVVVQDLRRAARESQFPEVRRPVAERIVAPEFEQAMELIESLRGRKVTADIETRKGQISCVGFGLSKTKAFCIPFMSVSQTWGYWTEEQEHAITLRMKDVLTDPSTQCIFQNGLYDCQYFAKQWGYIPNVSDDTMLMQHVAFPGMAKSLDFMASLYCEYYCYWKDDGKEWDPRIHHEAQHWTYNCDDCLYTFEVWETLDKSIKAFGLEQPYQMQMGLFLPVLRMMLRGCRVDKEFKNWLNGILLRQMGRRQEWFEKALGHSLNPDNHHQMKSLFYNDLRQAKVFNRKTRMPTTDDDAMDIIKTRQPLLRPLCDKIQEARSLRVFRSTFALAQMSDDDRMRCSYNITGAETYRFSSSKDAFGTGCNLQTIPKGQDLLSLLKSVAEGSSIKIDDALLKVTSPLGDLDIDESDPDYVLEVVRNWRAKLNNMDSDQLLESI